MNAHTAIVFTRYMMLSVGQRRNTDEKTFIDAPMDTVMEYFHIREQELEEFTASFIQRLPKYMQDALKYGQNAA